MHHCNGCFRYSPPPQQDVINFNFFPQLADGTVYSWVWGKLVIPFKDKQTNNT